MISKQTLKEMMEKRNAMAMELKKKLDADFNNKELSEEERESVKKLQKMMERGDQLMRRIMADIYIDPVGQWWLKDNSE